MIKRCCRTLIFEVLCVFAELLGRLGALRAAGRVRELAGRIG